ncbi:hypothetical protein D3C80_580920 [compost metagenome]
MPAQVVVHEGGDEIVRVVVTLVHAERQADIGALHGFLEQPWAQTIFQKAVRLALIDQKLREARAIRDECAGIVLAP